MGVEPGGEGRRVGAVCLPNFGLVFLLKQVGEGGADCLVARHVEEFAGLVQFDNCLFGIVGRLRLEMHGAKQNERKHQEGCQPTTIPYNEKLYQREENGDSKSYGRSRGNRKRKRAKPPFDRSYWNRRSFFIAVTGQSDNALADVFLHAQKALILE